jgi:hypothetical protein
MQEVGGHFQLVGLRVLQLQVAPFDASERTKSHHLVHLRVGEPQPVVEANPLPRLKVAHPDQFELCPVLCLAHAGLCFAPPARWRNPAALSGQLSPPPQSKRVKFSQRDQSAHRPSISGMVGRLIELGEREIAGGQSILRELPATSPRINESGLLSPFEFAVACRPPRNLPLSTTQPKRSPGVCHHPRGAKPAIHRPT